MQANYTNKTLNSDGIQIPVSHRLYNSVKEFKDSFKVDKVIQIGDGWVGLIEYYGDNTKNEAIDNGTKSLTSEIGNKPRYAHWRYHNINKVCKTGLIYNNKEYYILSDSGLNRKGDIDKIDSGNINLLDGWVLMVLDADVPRFNPITGFNLYIKWAPYVHGSYGQVVFPNYNNLIDPSHLLVDDQNNPLIKAYIGTNAPKQSLKFWLKLMYWNINGTGLDIKIRAKDRVYFKFSTINSEGSLDSSWSDNYCIFPDRVKFKCKWTTMTSYSLANWEGYWKQQSQQYEQFTGSEDNDQNTTQWTLYLDQSWKNKTSTNSVLAYWDNNTSNSFNPDSFWIDQTNTRIVISPLYLNEMNWVYDWISLKEASSVSIPSGADANGVTYTSVICTHIDSFGTGLAYMRYYDMNVIKYSDGGITHELLWDENAPSTSPYYFASYNDFVDFIHESTGVITANNCNNNMSNHIYMDKNYPSSIGTYTLEQVRNRYISKNNNTPYLFKGVVTEKFNNGIEDKIRVIFYDNGIMTGNIDIINFAS